MPNALRTVASPSGYNYSCYVSHSSTPLCTEPSYNVYGDYIGLKELMNRIYKLELDVYELKQQLNQRGTIKL